MFFVNSAAKKLISIGYHPLDGVTWGGPPPPLVTPLRSRTICNVTLFSFVLAVVFPLCFYFDLTLWTTLT